jgi:hypothetical protein
MVLSILAAIDFEHEFERINKNHIISVLFGLKVDDNDDKIHSDSINLIQDQNTGIVMLFISIHNKIVFFQVTDKSLNEEIKTYMPFTDIKHPHHG